MQGSYEVSRIYPPWETDFRSLIVVTGAFLHTNCNSFDGCAIQSLKQWANTSDANDWISQLLSCRAPDSADANVINPVLYRFPYMVYIIAGDTNQGTRGK